MPRKKIGCRLRRKAPSSIGVVNATKSFQVAQLVPTSGGLSSKDAVPLLPVSAEEPQPSPFVDRGLPLPEEYGYDRIVASPRNPSWVFCYWELSGNVLERTRSEHGQNFDVLRPWILRTHRVDEDIAVDVQIDPSVGSWYVEVGKPGRYQFELGLLSENGEMVSLVASLMIETPPETVSDDIDEEWRSGPDKPIEFMQYMKQVIGLDLNKGSGLPSSFGAVVPGRPSSLGLPSSMMSSWMGVPSSLGASKVGRPLPGSMSFMGASGMPSSPGPGGSTAVGWITGVDGAKTPALHRPFVGGGPNWNFQANLKSDDADKNSLKLPRVLRGIPLPVPTWP